MGALLRGEHEEPVPIGYTPQYAANVPRPGQPVLSPGSAPASSPRRNAPVTMGGLSAVVEEDRAGTWGQFGDNDSQATWLSDDAVPTIPLNAMPREPGSVPTLPSPLE